MTREEQFALKRRLRERYSADEKRVYEIAVEEIDRMNTTENKGEWILKERTAGCSIDIDIVCSRCGYIGIEGYAHGYELNEIPVQEMKDYIKKFDMNYCACCGADMRGGTDVERRNCKIYRVIGK